MDYGALRLSSKRCTSSPFFLVLDQKHRAPAFTKHRDQEGSFGEKSVDPETFYPRRATTITDTLHPTLQDDHNNDASDYLLVRIFLKNMADSTTSTVGSHEPTLSRRVKSCEACRKMKVKCIFEPHQAALLESNNTVESDAARCRRCIARNLQCHVSSNLQSILEKDLSWKARLQEQLERQQAQIERLNVALERVTGQAFSTGRDWSPRSSEAALSPQRSKRVRRDSDPKLLHSGYHRETADCDRREGSWTVELDQEGEDETPQHDMNFYGDQSQAQDAESSVDVMSAPRRTSSSESSLDGESATSFTYHRTLDPPYRCRSRDVQNSSPLRNASTHARSRSYLSPRQRFSASPLIPNQTSSGPDSFLPIRAIHQKETDLISGSLLPLSTAQDLFHFYLLHLDPQIYHLLRVCCYTHPKRGPDKALDRASSDLWLEELRSSSTLLLLAVLAVAALHRRDVSVSSGREARGGGGGCHPFQLLYRDFVRLAATLSFSRQQTLDDIRALVIGAYWLPDISWILVGTAVRVATERGLHLSYKKTPSSSSSNGVVALTPTSTTSTASSCTYGGATGSGSNGEAETWYQEARLYFLIYLVDHHASIPHGRPPMTRQHSVIRHATDWLSRCSCNSQIGLRAPDQRLISHTQLWETMHDLIDFAGTDVNKALDRTSVELSARFETKLKRWLDETLFRTSLLYAGDEAVRVLNEVRIAHGFAYLFLESSAFRTPAGCLPDFIAVASTVHGSSSSVVFEKRKMAERATAVALQLISALNPSPGSLGSLSFAGDQLRFAPAWMYSMLVSSLVFLVKVHEMLEANRCTELLAGCSRARTMQALTGAIRELEYVRACVSEHHIAHKVRDGATRVARQLGSMNNPLTNRSYATPRSPDNRLATPSYVMDRAAEAAARDPQMQTSSSMDSSTGAQAASTAPTMAGGAMDGAMEINQFDLLSDLHPISGLDFWPEILMDPAVSSSLGTGGGVDELLGESSGTLNACVQ